MDVLLGAGRIALDVAIAVAVMLGITSLTLHLLEKLAHREFFQVPLFFMIAKLLGAGLGVAFVYEQYERHYYDLGRLFRPESPWNISAWQFLVERTNPIFYSPVTAASAATEQGMVPPLVLVGIFALVIGTMAIAAFRLWNAADASRGIILTILFAIWIGYLILFGVSLVFWLLFWLNVWALLVVAIVVQHFRHRA